MIFRNRWERQLVVDDLGALKPGWILGGQYKIVELLDQGGQGTVYQVEQLTTGRMRALKLMFPLQAAAPALRARFEREARVGAQIRSDHVIEVTDAGYDPTLSLPYIVMELLEGETLSKRIARIGAAPAHKARWVLDGVCHAMSAAHSAGVVHRDLKPENIFLARRHGTHGRQQVKVLDFGIAKILQETHASDTTRALGTPAWLAPEQTSAGSSITPATDVWAIGLLAYFVFTGRIFWQTPSAGSAYTPQILREVLIEEILAPSVRAAQQGIDSVLLPTGFDEWFLRCVVRAENQRYQHAAACHRAFEQLFAVPGERVVSQADADRSSPLTPAHSTHLADPSASMTNAMTPQDVSEASMASAPRGPIIAPLPSAHRPSKAGRQRSTAAIGLSAAALLLATGLLIAKHFRTEGRKEGATQPEPSHNPTPPQIPPMPSEVVINSTAIARGRGWVAVNTLAPGDTKPQHHFRMLQKAGQILKIERVDPTGQVQQTRTITYSSNGGAEEVLVDSVGTLIETVTFTADGVERHLSRSGSPLTGGCAQLRKTFNEQGEIESRECQDRQGHAIIDTDGCHVLRYEHNAQHQVTAERCFAADGTPSLDRYGAHLWRLEYDAMGRQTEWAAFDQESHAVPDQDDGCTRSRYEFDDAGNRTTEKCIGSTGLVSQFHGVDAAVKKWTFDSHGCRVKEEYATAEGKPTSWGDVAAVLWTRDSTFARFTLDAEVESLDCAALSEERRSRDGITVERIEYSLNRSGQIQEQRCLKSGVVSACSGGSAGIRRFKYDDKGNLTSVTGFDSNGNPAPFQRDYPHEEREEWDGSGLNVRVSYFDTNGHSATGLGMAYQTITYDELGSRVESAFWGLNGEPVSVSLGMHSVRSSYDERHRLSAIELFDGQANPVAAKNLSMENVPWGTGPVKVLVLRNGNGLQNRFVYADGHDRIVDCTVSVPCHR